MFRIMWIPAVLPVPTQTAGRGRIRSENPPIQRFDPALVLGPVPVNFGHECKRKETYRSAGGGRRMPVGGAGAGEATPGRAAPAGTFHGLAGGVEAGAAGVAGSTSGIRMPGAPVAGVPGAMAGTA